MISGIFTRINEGPHKYRRWFIILLFLFPVVHLVYFHTMLWSVKDEFVKFIVPVTCGISYPNFAPCVRIREKGIDQSGIVNVEKQLIGKGYVKIGVYRYETEKFKVIKEYEHGNTCLTMYRR